jgi:hypothetical protein
MALMRKNLKDRRHLKWAEIYGKKI